jgi:hypothetical protein
MNPLRAFGCSVALALLVSAACETSRQGQSVEPSSVAVSAAPSSVPSPAADNCATTAQPTTPTPTVVAPLPDASRSRSGSPASPSPIGTFPVPSPTPRADEAMAWDGRRSQLLMFGGYGRDLCAATETWTWTTSGWVQRFPAHRPPGRAYSNMAFDPKHGVVVLFSGLLEGSPTTVEPNDTWVWDGSDWSQANPAHQPPGRNGAGFAYSDKLGQLVLVGGGNAEGNAVTDTWGWDGADWTQLSTFETAPAGDVLGYQTATGSLVMLAGLTVNGAPLSVWIFDGKNWARAPGGDGPVRNWAGAAWDSESSRFVIFGGADESGVSQPSTLIWDGKWTTVPTDIQPPPTGSIGFSPGLVWDPVDRSAVLFGGADKSGRFLMGTWAWDGAAWAQVAL